MKVLFLCFLAIACFACNKAERKADYSNPITIRSGELLSAYDNNIVAAKSKFENKPVLVTGNVERMSEQSGGLDIFISRNTPSGRFLVAQILDSEKSKAATINQNKDATFLCIVEGLVGESAVSLKDCQIK